jgi:hypothetical protein
MMSLTTMTATSSLMHCDEARVRHHVPDEEVAEEAAVSTSGTRRGWRLIAAGVMSLLITSLLLLHGKRIHDRPERPIAAPIAASGAN